MKRGFIIIAIVIVVVGLLAAGCGDDPDKTSTTGLWALPR